jgi:hypothetical protein
MKRSVASQSVPPEHDVNVDSEKPPIEHSPLLQMPVVSEVHEFSEDEK